MTPHIDKEQCLKDKEWREVHDFIASTKPYRVTLDESIHKLSKDMGGIRAGVWAVALVVLIPFFMGLIWIGEVGEKVERHGKDIVEIQQDIKEIRSSHGKMRP